MDHCVGAGDDLEGLAEVGQVGDQAQPVGAAVADEVDVEHVVAVLAQVAHDPAAGLAAAAGHHDAHLSDPP